MTAAFASLLLPQRLTEVVDVGASPIDGEPPYAPMLSAGLCRVTGFEPQEQALLELQRKKGPDERYLPYAVGDGAAHTLNLCLGDLDLELRNQGFIPHCFAAVKTWPIAPRVSNRSARAPYSQLLEADLVYVRDFSRPDLMRDEQLKHLALIAHHCYGSFDLALRCVLLLQQRQALEGDAQHRYLQLLSEMGNAGRASASSTTIRSLV